MSAYEGAVWAAWWFWALICVLPVVILVVLFCLSYWGIINIPCCPYKYKSDSTTARQNRNNQQQHQKNITKIKSNFRRNNVFIDSFELSSIQI